MTHHTARPTYLLQSELSPPLVQEAFATDHAQGSHEQHIQTRRKKHSVSEDHVRALIASQAHQCTAGVDEAGRGCLAGPVVAAAVILPLKYDLPGLGDSKIVPPTRRAGLAAQIGQTALAWGLGVVWPAEIDRLNILEATFKAMSRAVYTLKTAPEQVFVDGNKTIPSAWLRRECGFMCSQKAIVDGDALIPAISAASILAKVFRDTLMDALARRYPGYGFEHHKGYGTKEHIAAIQALGTCPMHRMTFRKVRADVQPLVQGTLS